MMKARPLRMAAIYQTLADVSKRLEDLFSAAAWRDRARRWSERAQGVDFSGVVRAEEAGLDPNRAQAYVSSGTKWLRRLFKDLSITPDDRILDVGCGKGGAMKVMLGFPFARVDGIEASERIAEVARANFAKLRIPAHRYAVITADATTFTALDDYNYVYLYNPFSCDVMAAFIANLAVSLARTPRPFTLIYDNPVCHDTIIASGAFRPLPSSHRDETGNPINMYAGPAGA